MIRGDRGGGRRIRPAVVRRLGDLCVDQGDEPC